MSFESIQRAGVGPPTLPQLRPTSTPEKDVPTTGSDGAAPAVPRLPVERPTVARETTESAPQLDPPPAGVDPELWSVLTSEERQFFSVSAEMGPVTYGREQTVRHETSLPRGRRLDVRV